MPTRTHLLQASQLRAAVAENAPRTEGNPGRAPGRRAPALSREPDGRRPRMAPRFIGGFLGLERGTVRAVQGFPPGGPKPALGKADNCRTWAARLRLAEEMPNGGTMSFYAKSASVAGGNRRDGGAPFRGRSGNGTERLEALALAGSFGRNMPRYVPSSVVKGPPGRVSPRASTTGVVLKGLAPAPAEPARLSVPRPPAQYSRYRLSSIPRAGSEPLRPAPGVVCPSTNSSEPADQQAGEHPPGPEQCYAADP